MSVNLKSLSNNAGDGLLTAENAAIENQKLRAALAVYADPEKWYHRYGSKSCPTFIMCGGNGWDVAAEALK